jgi:hypothetical protein
VFAGEQKPVLPVSDDGQHELEASLTSPTGGNSRLAFTGPVFTVGIPCVGHTGGSFAGAVERVGHRSYRVVGGSLAVFCALNLFPVLAGARTGPTMSCCAESGD